MEIEQIVIKLWKQYKIQISELHWGLASEASNKYVLYIWLTSILNCVLFSTNIGIHKWNCVSCLNGVHRCWSPVFVPL